ncbi:TetR/AcrR family transcriptional regulator [Azoarcus olearius]|uniref:TetR family transcriptional regulator n=1 Tax=Azoarcus sp. (strain BH72) TaxID=418699 RepID=A1K8E9_AZOSB|nr:TetR/AcrR family transcriptional regulator [Azoarcus olearius]CAL95104.1 putative TetR family transcriptional regulator [Azoarcus olearius]
MSELPPDRRSRKRQQTADHLVGIAFELFARHGYGNVTMEQIAAAADVAKGTLYNHFPVKEALVRHRFHMDFGAVLPELLARLQTLPDCASRLREFVRLNASYFEQHREYVGPYLRYRLGQPINLPAAEGRSGLDRVYAQLLEAGQARGEIRRDLPLAHLTGYLVFLHLACMVAWVQKPGSSLAQEFDTMLDLFLTGALAEVSR